MENLTRKFLIETDSQTAYERGCTDTELMSKKILLPLRICFENHFGEYVSTAEINIDSFLITVVAEVFDLLFFSMVNPVQMASIFNNPQPGSVKGILYKKFHSESEMVLDLRNKLQLSSFSNGVLKDQKEETEKKLKDSERTIEDLRAKNRKLKSEIERLQNRLDEVNNSGQLNG